MNILCIGDVVGSGGCEFLRSKLPGLKKLKGVDMVIVNGENSADGNGITPASFAHLSESGADVVTGGNHSFRRRECYSLYDESETLLRPANFPKGSTPGRGLCIYDMGRIRVAVINLMGTVYLENLRSPFEELDELLKTPDLPKICILDFHAEATGEKRAMGFYADGRVSAMFGTHTHVQTADCCILPRGTGYITDVGMVGAVNSVLGVKPECIIKKLTEKMPVRFENAKEPYHMDCVLFSINERSGLCENAESFSIL